MKMIPTPAPVGISQYKNYVHNCRRNAACEPAYSAPVPGVPYVQLYVDFGQYEPIMFEIHIQDHCTPGHTEQIFPNNYIIGQTPEGNWYGVFKYFNAPAIPVTTFVIWLSAMVDAPGGPVEKTFFSEMLMDDPCGTLTKVKSCHPADATTTGFDVNGVYYGEPSGSFSGFAGIRYFHIAYVRTAKVREMANKATFKSSLVRNFRTTIEKTYQLETELVPKWYKDVLLAIYARGAIQIDDGRTYLVSDLNFEALNDDDLTWRPYPQMKETFNLYFGCDDSSCVECCSPAVISAAVSDSVSPDESPGEPANTIVLAVEPCQPEPVNGWKVIYRPIGGGYREVPGRFFTSPIEFSTSLDPAGTQYEGFIQGDCGDGKLGVLNPWTTDESPSVSPGESPSASPEPVPCTQWFNPGPANAEDITYTDCEGNLVSGITLTPGSNFCAREVISGPAEGIIEDGGPC